MKAADVVKYYGGPKAVAWLRLVKSRQYGHGSELVEALGDKADNVASAQRILRACLDEKALVRCRFNPTREQRFFGSGGSFKLNDFALECFHYAPGENL